MDIERELKLLAGEGFSEQALLQATSSLATLSETGLLRVQDVYMETRARSLARAGLSGRWRRVGRTQSVQVKPVPLLRGMILQRVELQAELAPGEDPARALRRLVEQSLPVRLRGFPVPEVELRSLRRRFQVLTDRCEAELSIDRTVVLRPGARRGRSFFEVELEQKKGSEQAFRELAEAVAGVAGLRPSGKSKHLQALDLAGLPVLVLASPPPALGPLSPCDEVARSLCLAQWRNVRAHETGTRVGLDAEYLHKMRVATRRLRAALRTFEPCFDRRTLVFLRTRLRYLAAVLGEVRDLDVQLVQLPARRQHLGEEPDAGWEALQRVLQGRREEGRHRLLQALDGPPYRRLCERAERIFTAQAPRRPRAHPGRQPVGVLAAAVLGRRVRAVLKAARRCMAAATPERVHALRIRGKRLRYACELFASLYSPAFEERARRLAEFQDVLGLFQDSMVCGDLARQLREQALAGARAEAAYLYVLGLLDGASRLAAEAASREVSEAFDRVRGRKALRQLTREARNLAEKISSLSPGALAGGGAHETLPAATRDSGATPRGAG